MVGDVGAGGGGKGGQARDSQKSRATSHLFFSAIWCNLVQFGAIRCNSSPGVAVRLGRIAPAFPAKKRCVSQSRAPLASLIPSCHFNLHDAI
jgi:hypothetical protein